MKYKLTKNKKTIGEITVYQIEALKYFLNVKNGDLGGCLLYTSPSPRDRTRSRMPSSA